MPSIEHYKRILAHPTNGQIRKEISDLIMEETWDEDIQSRIGYLYDQFHDDEIDKSINLNSEKSITKIPCEIKLMQSTYNSLASDEQSMHIMFKPSYNFDIPYYDEVFSKYGYAEKPIGLYIDIPDEKGIYRRWLIVDHFTLYATQFPSFEILPCDYKLQWINNYQKLESWCCLRAKSSYNSGVYRDRVIEKNVNQRTTICEMNKYTESIYYNNRICISAYVQEREPSMWRCTKIEDTTPIGINKITWYQDVFNQHTDYIEQDADGKIIGVWCDFFESVIPTPPPIDIETNIVKITYSGVNQEIKVNGSFKKFTADYYDKDNNHIEFQQGTWSFILDDNDISDLFTIKTSLDDETLSENQIKIKFIGSASYIGKIFTIHFKSDESDIEGLLDIKIVGL